MLSRLYTFYVINFFHSFHCRFFKLIHFLYIFQAMASPEEKSYEIMRELDVNYVLVIFGGLTGYSSDGKINITVL